MRYEALLTRRRGIEKPPLSLYMVRFNQRGKRRDCDLMRRLVVVLRVATPAIAAIRANGVAEVQFVLNGKSLAGL